MIEVPERLNGRHFTQVADWSADELTLALDLADELKRTRADGREAQRALLPGRTLGMIFQKPSTRTRVSFEAGISELGAAEAEKLLPELDEGSMRPKIEAAARFVRGGGSEALITSFEELERALDGHAGTRVFVA